MATPQGPKGSQNKKKAFSSRPQHTAAANEYADRPRGEQKALFEKLRKVAGTNQERVEDIAQVTSSIVRSLTQALHTDDRALLDEILQNTERHAIASTVHRLDPAGSLDLLNRCIEIFQVEPKRAQEVLPWIREVVKTHAVFLMAQPEISEVLAPVQHAIREHLAMFPKLLLLEGRLELLLSRLPGYEAMPINPRPLGTFTESIRAHTKGSKPEVNANQLDDDMSVDEFTESESEDEGFFSEKDDDDDDDDDEEGNAAEGNAKPDVEDYDNVSKDGSLHDSEKDEKANDSGEEEEDEDKESAAEPEDLGMEGV